ncbi:hypothetical protein DASC09_012920 [Saccharomycopsis crataegensis]|uniref:Rad21/Rec8-like protein N-terminal domain-containing protein n=1 Tax=Saccharomycopsis crataegensis TaxID=43959 RepID=A0AAV5QH63_9ASCO|nr:hypothetical protein DASC09_012920 [Saccharomycopsis crataegensis]
MFLTSGLLTTQDQSTGIGTIWLLATLGNKSSHKRLQKREISDVSIPDVCAIISSKVEPSSLKLSSRLLYGISIAHKQKTTYLYLEACVTKNNIQKNILYKKISNKDSGHHVLPIQGLLNVGPANIRPIVTSSFSRISGGTNSRVAKVLFLADDGNFDVNRDLVQSDKALADLLLGDKEAPETNIDDSTEFSKETAQRRQHMNQIHVDDQSDSYNVSLVFSPIHSTPGRGDEPSNTSRFQYANISDFEAVPNNEYNHHSLIDENNDMLGDVVFEFDQSGDLLFNYPNNNIEPTSPAVITSPSPAPNVPGPAIDAISAADGFGLDFTNIEVSLPIENLEDHPTAVSLKTSPSRSTSKTPWKRSGTGFIQIDDITAFSTSELRHNRDIFEERMDVESKKHEERRLGAMQRYKGGIGMISITGNPISAIDIIKRSRNENKLYSNLIRQTEHFSAGTTILGIATGHIRQEKEDEYQIEVGRHKNRSRSASISKNSVGDLFERATAEIGRHVDLDLDASAQEQMMMMDFANDPFGTDFADKKYGNGKRPLEEDEEFFLDFSGQPLDLDLQDALVKRRRTASVDGGLRDVLFGNFSRSSSRNSRFQCHSGSMSRSRSRSQSIGPKSFNLINQPLYEISVEQGQPNTVKVLNGQVKRFFEYLQNKVASKLVRTVENATGSMASSVDDIPTELISKFQKSLDGSLAKLTFEDIAPSKYSERDEKLQPEDADGSKRKKACSRSLASSAFLCILQLASRSLIDLSIDSITEDHSPSKPKDIAVTFNY